MAQVKKMQLAVRSFSSTLRHLSMKFCGVMSSPLTQIGIDYRGRLASTGVGGSSAIPLAMVG